MLISIGYMCLMLCAPLDWQYAELPSSASDAVLCSVLVRKMWVKKKNTDADADIDIFGAYIRHIRGNLKAISLLLIIT